MNGLHDAVIASRGFRIFKSLDSLKKREKNTFLKMQVCWKWRPSSTWGCFEDNNPQRNVALRQKARYHRDPGPINTEKLDPYCFLWLLFFCISIDKTLKGTKQLVYLISTEKMCENFFILHYYFFCPQNNEKESSKI